MPKVVKLKKSNIQTSTSFNIEEDWEHSLKVLKKELRMTLRLIPIAELAYKEKPIQFNANALKILTEQSIMLMDKIKQIENNETAQKLISNILDPMIEAFIKNLSSDLSKLQDDLIKMKPDKSNTIKTKIKEVLSNFGVTGKSIYEQVKKDITDAI